MALYPDKYSRRIYYPFETQETVSVLDDILKAILDCRFTLRAGTTLTGTGYTRPFGVMLTGAYTSSAVLHVTFKAYDVEKSMQWLFDCALSGEGIYSDIYSVDYAETSEALLIVDADKLPIVSTAVTGQTIHLRSDHIILVPERITNIILKNKSLDVDPTKRTSFSTVSTITKNGVLSLRDGYNCRLKYNENTGVLQILPAPGAGIGKYSADPWSGTYPDVWTGIKTVNGQNNSGDIRIEATKSLGITTVKNSTGDIVVSIGGSNG